MARILDAFAQFLDNNGNPLTGGKLYFYEPGSSVPKTVYSDVDETVALTNPTILDANGRIAGVFGPGSYRVVVKDANDVQIIPRDSVSGVHGIPFGSDWTADASYSLKAVVKHNNLYWQSAIGDNTGNNPTSDDGTNWLPWPPNVGDALIAAQNAAASATEAEDSATAAAASATTATTKAAEAAASAAAISGTILLKQQVLDTYNGHHPITSSAETDTYLSCAITPTNNAHTKRVKLTLALTGYMQNPIATTVRVVFRIYDVQGASRRLVSSFEVGKSYIEASEREDISASWVELITLPDNNQRTYLLTAQKYSVSKLFIENSRFILEEFDTGS